MFGPRQEDQPGAAGLRAPVIDEWPSPRTTARYTLGWIVTFVCGMTAMAALRALVPGPRWSFYGVVLAAVAAGVVLAIVRGRIVTRRVAALARDGRPTWDADWRGPRDVVTSSAFASRVPPWTFNVVGVGGAIALSVAFDEAGSSGDWASMVPCGGFAALAVAALVGWVVLRGGAQVKFARFPYLLGEPAVFYVAATAGSPLLEDAQVLLRCVGCPTCGECRRADHLLTLWSRRWVAPAEGSPGPDEFVAATFHLPADAPGTALHGRRHVRWELLVAGRSRWGRVVESFVVPVYAAGTRGSVAAGAETAA